MGFSKNKLSGSINGRMIKVVATSTPGTLIHTSVSGTVDFDEIWLYAVNSSTSVVKLTIEFGGTTSPDDLIEVGIPAESGLVQIVPGSVLQNGVVVRAFSSAANDINILGWVNEISV